MVAGQTVILAAEQGDSLAGSSTLEIQLDAIADQSVTVVEDRSTSSYLALRDFYTSVNTVAVQIPATSSGAGVLRVTRIASNFWAFDMFADAWSIQGGYSA